MTDERKDNGTYKTGGYNKPQRERGSQTVEILPSADVLESYNYVVDGSADMILAMFDYEQQHRHEMEKQSLRIHAFSTILGQIFGFFIAITAFASATMLGLYGSETLAAIIWVFAAALVVMAGLVWAYVKNAGQRTLIDRAVIRPNSDV
ncbi:MAG: DUF2335 domain-containing protein [Alphaproteobacteria bacterium]|nr:DUF2335 domain-containing protein [Alphaproteobacteria bacterium]